MEPGFPVWTIRPNWREGVMERLEWLTDVLAAASSGAEQRRALRLSPRRYVEITVHPTRQERSFLDLMLHRNGSEEWLFPLWFDVAKLSEPATATGTRVDFDTTFREHGMGEYALLFKDAFTWEVISVAGYDDDGLDLADPLDATWPTGTIVYPLRRARLPIETSLNALTGRVGESVLLFQLTQANDFIATAPTDLLFEGVPVLTMPPNRSQEITLDHVRLAAERDNSTGIPYRDDPVDRAFQIQGHNWTIQGREAQFSFRSFLYWLRGRQRSLWLPSFNDDIITTRNSALSSVNLDIEKIGMAYAGGVVPGRDVVIVNGVPGRITELGAPQSASEERLRIGAGLSGAVPAGKSGSFMSMCRLNQDAIELMHHTDTDGLLEVSASFQSFANNRDPSGVIYFPIPVTAKTDERCGTFTPHMYWRVRFLNNATDRFRVKNIQFRRFATDTGTTPCGTLEQCRASNLPFTIFSEAGFGTHPEDVYIYGGGAGDWSSNLNGGSSNTTYVGRYYPSLRDCQVLGIVASSNTGASRTSITRMAVDWSDDGVSWTNVRIIDTNGDWAPGETRSWDLF